MFKTSPFMEKIFFIFTLIAQGSSFLRPSAYALMHRDHHKYSDTNKDPHSPTSFKNIFSFMIKTANEYKVYTEIAEKRVNDESLPRWDSFEKFADSYICRTFFVLLYISIYIYFSPYYWL